MIRQAPEGTSLKCDGVGRLSRCRKDIRQARKYSLSALPS